jgi:small GTP-binding protein
MKNNFGADLKIVVVGNAGTGKTSFVNKWTKNTFSEKYRATIVSEFAYKIINYNGVVYRVQIWDLAGQDKNTHVTKIFCKDAHGAVILAACGDSNSLKECEKWKTCIDENSQFIDKTSLPCILVENKYDLLSSLNNPISDKDFASLSNSLNFSECFRSSAKDGTNVNESMNSLISLIVSKLSKLNLDEYKKNNESSSSIKLNKKDKEKSKEKNKSCC